MLRKREGFGLRREGGRESVVVSLYSSSATEKEEARILGEEGEIPSHP